MCIRDRDKGGLETFEAALVLGNHTRSVKDLINLTQNLDLYRFYPDISDDEGLGRLYADELGTCLLYTSCRRHTI